MLNSTPVRLLKIVGLAGSLLVGSMVVAQAATVFSEDFSGANEGGYGVGTLTGTQFKVTDANVDVIGPATYTCVANAGIKCVDLVGDQGHGAIESTVGIDLHAGNTYTISYTDVLQGYAAGSFPAVAYTVSLGSQIFSPISIPTVQLMSLTFTAAADEVGALLSFIVTAGADSVHGPVVSGISVSETAAVAATPIPAALPLFASALGGLGFMGWRRRRVAR